MTRLNGKVAIVTCSPETTRYALACLVLFQAMLVAARGSRDAARAARKARTAATPSTVALNSKVAR